VRHPTAIVHFLIEGRCRGKQRVEDALGGVNKSLDFARSQDRGLQQTDDLRMGSLRRVIAIDPRSQGESTKTSDGNTPSMGADDAHHSRWPSRDDYAFNRLRTKVILAVSGVIVRDAKQPAANVLL